MAALEEEARAMAVERHRRHSWRYLMGIPNLGDCLEEGFVELGHNVGDIEINTQ